MARAEHSPKPTNSTEADAHAARLAAGLAAIAEWEEEHGHFTPDEMAEAYRQVQAQSRSSHPAGSLDSLVS